MKVSQISKNGLSMSVSTKSIVNGGVKLSDYGGIKLSSYLKTFAQS
jgi:hypothetical protein